ncbi:dTDP-4-dehydrorhamnose reductase [Neorhizobium sp. T786]|uniref:dTDP-4-dehydrorhamnose reductase n=1 Tax=Pseudorhizobium xiangyangii TaxID=2883104 RepID=UPI001CFFB032|nr:dTDP-4-dehydrorhamnose reductase [Neorhizobium xiangyangii]MCB5204653.1 dTDP-4-dehydrorhamnose reductase [Neorhizobium xiangyangii]
MRVVVTGTKGQTARCLQEIAPSLGLEILTVGRPQLDLMEPASVLAAITRARPDIIVSAAAYTAVDLAETEVDTAFSVNVDGAGAVAQAAAALDAPLIHMSTDYVFAGDQASPYRETDVTRPLSIYGLSKRKGEVRVEETTGNHVILRIGWLYSPFGRNFVRTMIDLAGHREQVNVVRDQRGGPTSAFDVAHVIATIAQRLVDSKDAGLRGIFHLAPQGDASWAELAEEVFRGYAMVTGKSVAVRPIATHEYPTAARRPARSTMDTTKLRTAFGICLPPWQASLPGVVERVIQEKVGELAS